MREIFSVLAGILFISGYIPYLLAIIRKQTKPAKSSWIIWATLDTITMAAMFAEGSINGQIIGALVGSWVVVIFTMKYGKSGWTKLDKFCIGGAVVGIALWLIFSNPLLCIAASMSVLFLGSIPTFVSAWKNPSHENKLGWTLFWLSCVFATIAIPKWTLADAAQPLTFLVIETTMMYILYFHAHKSS